MANRHDRTLPLRVLVANRRAELGMSLRAVGEKSGLSHTAIGNIENGILKGAPADDTLQALALALDLPVSRLRDAAGVAEPDPEWRLPVKYRGLRPEARRVVEQVADLLLRAQGDENGAH